MKSMQSEAVMDTLIQNSAQLVVALYNKDIFGSGLARGKSRRKSCGAAADNYDINCFHHCPSPL